MAVPGRRSRRLRSSLIAALAAGAAISSSAVAAAAVGPAVAGPRFVVTMFSDHGDYIGAGVPQEFDQTNAAIGGSLSASGISLSVSGGTSGTDWTLDVDPARGATLKVGYYRGAQRAVFRTAGHPGLDISGDGRGCNTVSGAFDVRDLAISNSAITRLDLLYEQHCEGSPRALFGEIQIGEPRPAGLIPASRSITWPAMGKGASGTPAPLYIRNPSAKSIQVGTAALVGLAAPEFHVALNSCSGTTLAPGDSCAMYIGFTAKTQGPQTARLRVPLGASTYQVQLDAPVTVGTTSLTMASQSGDYIGQGETYNFTTANSAFSVSASTAGLAAGINGPGGAGWTVEMYPGDGQILAVGNYPNATRYPFNGTGNGLDVSGEGRGCNTLTGSFTVKQIVFSATDNSLQHFDGTFVQHCEGATPALTGELKFKWAPVITPPPGVGQLHVTSSSGVLGVTWVNPTVSRFRYTVVRVEPSGAPAGVAPFAGLSAYAGIGKSVKVHGLIIGHRYTVAVFTVDQYGNVSSPARYAVTLN
jgi:hypothetical protein